MQVILLDVALAVQLEKADKVRVKQLFKFENTSMILQDFPEST